jgi:hypothetical protein
MKKRFHNIENIKKAAAKTAAFYSLIKTLF